MRPLAKIQGETIYQVACIHRKYNLLHTILFKAFTVCMI